MCSELLQFAPDLPCTPASISISTDDLALVGASASNIFSQATTHYLRLVSGQDGCHNVVMAKAMSDRCWEEFNTSHWADVPDIWRSLYSYAALYRTAFHLHTYLLSSRSDSLALSDALYCCDMGLIMGKPVIDGFQTRLAARCHKELALHPKTDKDKHPHDDIGHPTEVDPSQEATAAIPVNPSPPIVDRLPRLCCPSLERFVREVFGQRPTVLTDCVAHWPALRWTLAGLERAAGHRTVPVELGRRYTDAGWSQRLMTLGQFISDHVRRRAPDGQPGYLAQYELFEQIPELGADVPTPDYCWVGERQAVHTNIWLGPAGTVSPLHHDPKHNCLVQVLGKKFVQVFAPEESPRLYPHDTPLLHNTSQVDAERPDLACFPKFAAARHQEVVLGPGDLLYMPPGWWHYVRSLSVSCSVSFWFE